MIRAPRCALWLLGLAVSGCVATKPPTIAHVHVGHAETAWPGTPGRQSLLAVAEQEATVARQHARFAVEAGGDLDRTREHVGHVLHAIDPDLALGGPGLGYGLLRAVEEATSHIGYAAEAEDATANVRASAPEFVKQGAAVAERARLIVALGEATLASDSAAEAEALAQEILRLAVASEIGADEDGDGTLGAREAGLQQMRRGLDEMIAREDPPYATVDTYYLFNLIRLPSGKWGYANQRGDYAYPTY